MLYFYEARYLGAFAGLETLFALILNLAFLHHKCLGVLPCMASRRPNRCPPHPASPSADSAYLLTLGPWGTFFLAHLTWRSSLCISAFEGSRTPSSYRPKATSVRQWARSPHPWLLEPVTTVTPQPLSSIGDSHPAGSGFPLCFRHLGVSRSLNFVQYLIFVLILSSVSCL